MHESKNKFEVRKLSAFSSLVLDATQVIFTDPAIRMRLRTYVGYDPKLQHSQLEPRPSGSEIRD
jgi:hypothetical protein